MILSARGVIGSAIERRCCDRAARSASSQPRRGSIQHPYDSAALEGHASQCSNALRTPNVHVGAHRGMAQRKEAPWPRQLAAADGRRTSRFPGGTSAVRFRHAWGTSTESPQLDVCCVQYDANGRRVRGGNVDRLYTRTEWQARTGEWRQAAQYSETSAAYELTVWLRNVAPTVQSLFVVLSAAAPLRTLPPAVLARESLSLSALGSGTPGEDRDEELLCDGLRGMSWWRRVAIDRRASDDTALVLCRLWRGGEASPAHTPAINTHPPCEWVFEEMTLGTFGRVGVCADHYAPIYAMLDAWVASQPLFFCAEDCAAAQVAVHGGMLVDETGTSAGVGAASHVGRIVLSNGDVFAGEWRGGGERHGHGSYIWAADGSRYDGDWVCNQREGPCGRMRYGNGEVYQGEWRADKRWGRGTMYFAGGVHTARYEGEWVSDAPDGEGVMAYLDGGVYEGGWVDGLRDGEGMMLYADGTLYLGSWRHDKRHGRGEISYSHGHMRHEVRYTGEWRDGVRQGEGQMEHAGTGATYSGQWAGRQTPAAQLLPLVPPLAAIASSQPEGGDAVYSSGRAAGPALFRHLEPNTTGPRQQEPLGVHRPRPRPQSQSDPVVSTARRSRTVTHTTSPAEAEPSANRQRSPPQQRRPSPPLLHRQTHEGQYSPTRMTKTESPTLQHSIDGGMIF